MVHCDITILFLAVLKLRKLNDPEEIEFAVIYQTKLLAQLDTQCAQNAPYNIVFIGSKQQQVTGLSIHLLHESCQLLLCHKFGKGRFVRTVLLHGQISQSLCTVALCKINEGIYLLSRHRRLSLDIQAAYRAAVFQRRCKYTEAAASNRFRNINQFHAETGIRLIGTITVHRVYPFHSLQRKRDIQADRLLAHIGNKALVHIHYIIHIYKGQLHIHLRKFRLTIRTQVLIAETLCNLEIAVIPGAHQQLLEQLRGLGQRIKVTGMHTAGNQIVSCALRSGFAQDRRFNLQKSLFRQKTTERSTYLTP